MRWTRIGTLLLAAGAIGAARDGSAQSTVSLSLNVFPTALANPNGGGTWRLVAKTNASLGIAGISAYIQNVNSAGITVESDINDMPPPGPNVTIISGFVNIVYGQDLSTAPIVAGVGTPSFSDGPDPFGNPVWDGATRIFAGTYGGVVPIFGTSGNTTTAANVLQSTNPGNPAAGAAVTTVVRVQVPEPATAAIAATAISGVALLRRRRSS